MRTLTFIAGLLGFCFSAVTMAGDEGYHNVQITKVTCKVVLEKEDRFRVEGSLEGSYETFKGFWGIRYSDRDSNYNFKLGAEKEGSDGIHFCNVLKHMMETKRRVHLIARACGHSCNDVRAFLDAARDPEHGLATARILK